jgi:hypothetical protein
MVAPFSTLYRGADLFSFVGVIIFVIRILVVLFCESYHGEIANR